MKRNVESVWKYDFGEIVCCDATIKKIPESMLQIYLVLLKFPEMFKIECIVDIQYSIFGDSDSHTACVHLIGITALK